MAQCLVMIWLIIMAPVNEMSCEYVLTKSIFPTWINANRVDVQK